MALRTSEWIAFFYFGSLILTSVLLPIPSRVRRGVVSAAVTVMAVILLLASLNGQTADTLRDWMPLMYLLAGYWLPARLVVGPLPGFEQKLMALDRRCFGRDGLTRFNTRAPRWLLDCLELSYLFCYPMVPLGFASQYLHGCGGRADRFWTAVLVAAFFCYGLLPWFPTRPPRAVEALPPGRPSEVRELNLRILGRASHQLNTFPSGHAAASVAVALAVAPCWPVAGLVFGVLALGIIAGSISGRYHYAADAVTGLIVAVIAFEISRLISN
jgi:hypothetical protein